LSCQGTDPDGTGTSGQLVNSLVSQRAPVHIDRRTKMTVTSEFVASKRPQRLSQVCPGPVATRRAGSYSALTSRIRPCPISPPCHLRIGGPAAYTLLSGGQIAEMATSGEKAYVSEGPVATPGRSGSDFRRQGLSPPKTRRHPGGMVAQIWQSAAICTTQAICYHLGGRKWS
jgi:hypothetical protein